MTTYLPTRRASVNVGIDVEAMIDLVYLGDYAYAI